MLSLNVNQFFKLSIPAFLASGVVYADSYTPPSSKPLYESNGEAGESLQFPSGLFLGGNASFGQSRHAGSGVDPRVAYRVNAEIGYAAGTGSWSRYEVSGEAFIGQIGNSEVKMPIKGVMAKIGTGHSIGNKMFALLKVGAGLALADYEDDVDGVTVKSKDSSAGLALSGSYSVLIPMAKYLHVLGGFQYSHYEFSFDKFKEGSVEFENKTTAVLNVPEIFIGMRMGI